MTDIPTNITQIIVGFVAGGGLVGLLNHFTNKRKFILEAERTNVDTAIRLRDEAIKEYNTAEEKLRQARKLLDEVQTELNDCKQYIEVLQKILDKNGLSYPKMEED